MGRARRRGGLRRSGLCIERPQCYPIAWTTASSTSAGTQTVASEGASIPVTTGLSGSAYAYPTDPAYTPLNMNSGSGSLAMSVVTSPTSTGAQRTVDYEYVSFVYPQNAIGPVTFTITNIDSYTTTANGRGAQYFTDSVQVLNDGAVVTPTASQNTTTTNQWITATSTAASAASYTINQPGTVEIRLRNAFTGTIPSGAHPNQTIQVSPVTCGTNAALPLNPTLQYRQRASQYGKTMCASGTSYSTYTINNTTPVGTSPLGFSVVKMPDSTGAMSPTTTITATGITYVLGLPKDSLNQSKLDNPFTFTAGGAYWTLDTTKTRDQTMTTPGGTTAVYRIYTFTFTGPTTSSSVDNSTSPRPA